MERGARVPHFAACFFLSGCRQVWGRAWGCRAACPTGPPQPLYFFGGAFVFSPHPRARPPYFDLPWDATEARRPNYAAPNPDPRSYYHDPPPRALLFFYPCLKNQYFCNGRMGTGNQVIYN